MTDARVGRFARLLGYSGLAPAVATTALVAAGDRAAAAIGAFYPLLILSFLGGIWWGFSVREGTRRQGVLAAVAVVPSLAALALGCGVVLSGGSPWSLVAIGTALLLTLPIDRWLTIAGIAPANWMRLRVPLSLGLGLLTIATGVLLALPPVG